MEGYQMDVFIEQIVKKKMTTADMLKIVGICFLTILVIFASFMIFPMIPAVGSFLSMLSPLIIVGACYGAYYLITAQNLEYEYIMTNGEIDIDKIINRRKRKRMITVNTRDFSEFGLYKDAPDASGMTTILACTSIDDPETYYAVLDHSKHGKCMLIFNPNEKLLKSAKQFIRRAAMKS